MQFSDCNCDDFEIYIFWEKCKQTAEISWLFSKISKFQKSLLMKMLTFFIVMSKHTLVFIVHPHKMKFLIFPINERIYVVIQKCKQISNLIRQLCNSQIVVEMILKFIIFGKNVNKQLKSADFFSQKWKFHEFENSP